MEQATPPSGGHRLVEHTADIGVSCWGETPAALFREAAFGLVEVMLGPVRVGGDTEFQVELHAASREELLVAWLNELLFRFETEGFAPAEIDFLYLGEGRLVARVKGTRQATQNWPVERQVKAATYHQLQIARNHDTWRTTVYLDL